MLLSAVVRIALLIPQQQVSASSLSRFLHVNTMNLRLCTINGMLIGFGDAVEFIEAIRSDS